MLLIKGLSHARGAIDDGGSLNIRVNNSDSFAQQTLTNVKLSDTGVLQSASEACKSADESHLMT